ncbi:MAG: DUF3179 domain-containing protein, partial [Anaerolineales bacterium]|nr:DUF3179 domain-containing protein [Anaerolineales bacterium]
MKVRKLAITIIFTGVFLSACASIPLANTSSAQENSNTSGSTTQSPQDEGKLTQDGSPTQPLLSGEPPPRGAEREFLTDFSKHTVPYSEILSGGVPKDGIPAIDAPQFIGVSEADAWLNDVEPVVLVEVGDDARAYPIQILMWHEIVNDTVGDLPLVITFCPLCNTDIVLERTYQGQVLDFGT